MDNENSKASGLHLLGVVIAAAGVVGGIFLGTEHEFVTDVSTFGGVETGFNWVLCLLAAGPGIVAGCVCFAGAHIVDQLRSRVEMPVLSVPASEAPPPTVPLGDNSTTPQENSNESGWYPDPYGDSGHRFWDGTQWTRRTAP